MAPSIMPDTHFDTIIIGAGMSGLAAGIRLAYFDQRVCIIERHYAFGGLNSYYRLAGRSFDVGLHAVTNFAPPEARNAPLNKLLRQLRLSRDDLALLPQRHSEIRFPERALRFTNDIDTLIAEVAREFPRRMDAFGKLLTLVAGYDDARLDAPHVSTRTVLKDILNDDGLTDMLLCPIMFYGSAEEHDMDFTQFVTLFKALYCEGFARPRDGVRTIIRALVRTYRGSGGTLRMNCGVSEILHDGRRAAGVKLDSGETLTADVVLSSAGACETTQLCGTGDGAVKSFSAVRTGPTPGKLSFVEIIGVLDRLPQHLGHDATIVFFNDAERFTYARPEAAVDERSGVICCPSNYAGHDDMAEGMFRLTWLANPDRWIGIDDASYQAAKLAAVERFCCLAERHVPDFRRHLIFTDMFTPRTIRRYTGHVNGAVYGSPQKTRDGRTALENLFICGTDQGYLGIVGALLSGITIANLHILSKS